MRGHGTVLVAFAEGLLIGIAYLLADVPSPVLLTLLTIAFATLRPSASLETTGWP